VTLRKQLVEAEFNLVDATLDGRTPQSRYPGLPIRLRPSFRPHPVRILFSHSMGSQMGLGLLWGQISDMKPGTIGAWPGFFMVEMFGEVVAPAGCAKRQEVKGSLEAPGGSIVRSRLKPPETRELAYHRVSASITCSSGVPLCYSVTVLSKYILSSP
jgi:hypothetical protein